MTEPGRIDTDAALMERLVLRDNGAMERIMALHAGPVHRMARLMLADHGVAEEVAQDVFLELWSRPERFDQTRGNLRTYLVGMTRNKAIDRLRAHYARERLAESLLKESETAASHVEGSEESFALRQHIFSALENLPPLQRDALVLAYYGGRTYREVANELGVPEGTAKTRLRQGLITLRRTLANDAVLTTS